MGRRLRPVERYGLRLTLLAAVVVLVAVPFSILLYEVLAGGPLTRVDGDLADRLNDLVHRHEGRADALQAVSWLGRPLTLWAMVAVAAAYTWHRRTPRLTLFLLATAAGGQLISTLTKILVDRPRPVVHHPVDTAFGKSFPSGHALLSTVVYGALLLTFLPAAPQRYRRAIVVATGVVVAAIGASRLLLGVHFLSDVLAGYVLGAAWLIGATAAFEIWRVERGRPPTDAQEEGVEPEAGGRLRSHPPGRPAA